MVSKLLKNSSNKPWFWFIAGPNGAGKSTWVNSNACSEILGEISILNPDHYSEAYTDHHLSLINAGKRIFNQINQLVMEKKSFAVETTLSGTHYLRLAQKLKQDDWAIGAVFIGVEGDDICASRVEERKLSGGHNVPLPDIIPFPEKNYNLDCFAPLAKTPTHASSRGSVRSRSDPERPASSGSYN
ncbi:MAG TPA: hypothetical protein VMW10_03565, partial [Alphaproteobacteria bacterium]|nr:hypothetical protein [Alphaproteobacteria bacterium]